MPWVAIKGLLLLGDKYELRQQGIRLVEAEYPKDIESWDRRISTNSILRIDNQNGQGAIIDLVGVSRRLALRDIYLAALYDCCNMDDNFIAHSVASTKADTCIKLEPHDLVAALTRTGLGPACSHVFTWVLTYTVNPDCTTDCRAHADSAISTWAFQNGRMTTSYNSLCPIELGLFIELGPDRGYCKSCVSYCCTESRTCRGSVRNDLAHWMKVGTDGFG